ncbi:Replication factor-A C terminal domain-containing protein [Forsythia ovata]|uniref:Replication factor-A C terminal domain-containing protein n=1 Tax=Forsythia ovata TaxID=205694 RepID=A0ABD1VNF8_9LAMI
MIAVREVEEEIGVRYSHFNVQEMEEWKLLNSDHSTALLEYERHKRLSDKLELPVRTLPETSVIDNEESYYQTHPLTRGVVATGKAENLSDIHAIHFLISYGAAQNEEKLSQMVTTQLYATLSPSKASVPHDDRITSIKDIQGLLPVQTFFWVKATATVSRNREPFWYMACQNCNRQSNGDYGETYFCLFCKSPQARAIPRARASIKLQDDTGMLHASIIGSPAERFLAYSANQLMECVDNHDKVRMSINTDQLFYLKAAPKNLELSIYTYEIILMMEDNVDHIEPMCTHKTMEHIQHDGINKTGTSIHQNPMEKEILGESSNNNSNVQVKRELADASKNQSTKKRANQPNISQIEDKVSQMNKEDIAVTQNDNLSTDTANERYESDETPHDSDYASF